VKIEILNFKNEKFTRKLVTAKLATCIFNKKLAQFKDEFI